MPTTSLCPDATPDPYACDCADGPRCPPWGALEGLWRLQSEPRTATWLRSGPYSSDRSDTSRSAYTHRPLTTDLEGAWRYHAESLAIRRDLGDQWHIAMSLSYLGRVASERGDQPTAWELHAESLALRRELGDKIKVQTTTGTAAT